MLMGFRELCKMEAANALIEVDSFSANQWGSGNSTCPWHFADWVEEGPLDFGGAATEMNFKNFNLLIYISSNSNLQNIYLFFI